MAKPTTNLGLQDRRGSARPQCTTIDATTPRTPQWRGLTAIQELRTSGVPVAAATDNVRDHWYPYGDYDLLSVWSLALQMGHLDTAPTAGHWADLVNDTAAQAMGCGDGQSLTVGAPADIVLFPEARGIAELLARPQTNRIVIRNGVAMDFALPDYDEMYDLVPHDS